MLRKLTASLLFVALILGVVLGTAGATMTRYPNGIAAATQTQCASATIATGAGDVYAAGDIEASGNLKVAGSGTIAGPLSVSSHTTVAGDIKTTTGKWASTVNNQTTYSMTIATQIANGVDYTVSQVVSKPGWFEIKGGTYTLTGTFTNAAAVSLGNSSTATSTTNNNAGTVNVYDGGTSIVVENQSGNTLQLFITVGWIEQ